MARSDVRRTILGIAAGVIVACFLGCDRGSSGDTAESQASEEAGTPASAEEDALRRYNAAVGALNAIGRHGLSSWRQYARQFDPERGPTGKEIGPFVDSVNFGRDKLDALRSALAGRSPGDTLDQASARYVTASEHLMSLTAEAHRYYDQEDWRDDKFAKGKAIHPELVAAYREFESAHTALSAEVRQIEDSRREARLSELKASGGILRHDVVLSLKQARDVIEFVEEQMATVEHPHQMDLAGLEERIDAYDATLATLRQAVSQGPERAEQELDVLAFRYLESYVSSGDRFLFSAKDVLRAGREGKPMPTVLLPQEDGLVGNYNRMVQSANNMNR